MMRVRVSTGSDEVVRKHDRLARGPDDEFLRGPLRITKGAVTCNATSKTRAKKVHGSMRVISKGAHGSPLPGGRIHTSTPANLPAAVRLNDLRIVPSGLNQARFPVLFPRNVEPHRVGFQNRRDLGEFLTGGW